VRLIGVLPGSVLAAVVAVGLAAPAGATTSPRVCGKVTIKGQEYLIKTHLLTCSKGKPYATTYLKRHRRPKGWKCTDYPPEQSAIAFTCRRSGRDFLAIRR
jgi:hypothetical protein